MVHVLPIVFATFCLFSQVTIGYVFHGQAQPWREENTTSYNPQSSVRNMLNLYSMIKCATKCDPWKLNNYGNYCGFGGSGIPINDIDSCCEQHDSCYDDNTLFYGCSSSMYLAAYDWSCKNGNPWCHNGYDKCGYWSCVCDKAFMECLNDVGCP